MLLRMGDFFSTILSLFLKNLVALQVEYKSLQECTQKIDNIKWAVASKDYQYTVSYTHLTLPTN